MSIGEAHFAQNLSVGSGDTSGSIRQGLQTEVSGAASSILTLCRIIEDVMLYNTTKSLSQNYSPIDSDAAG